MFGPIHGYPVAAAVIAFGIGAGLWHYRRAHRFTAWLFTVTASLLAIGVTVWTDSLASLVHSGTGLTALVLVFLAGGFGFWFEAVRKHGHHRIRTPVTGLVFGTTLVLVGGELPRLLREAARSPGKTGSALAQSMSQIRSGHAAASHGHQVFMVLTVAAGVLVVLVMLARRHDNGSRGRIKGGDSARPAQRAIGG